MRGPDLPLLTQNLVKKYLSDDRTGAVICVINAEAPEVQNAAIFGILADLTEELKSNCIGVFAKTDLSLSRDQGCIKVQASIRMCEILYFTAALTLILLLEMAATSHKPLQQPYVPDYCGHVQGWLCCPCQSINKPSQCFNF